MTQYFIETDLGRDPDDMIALLWLLAQPDTHIQTIFITPGDSDQVAIANFIRNECDHNFQICVPNNTRFGKKSSGGVHYEMLNKYGYKIEATPDKYHEPINEKSRILSIGPMTNLHERFASVDLDLIKTTIQGGFVPYSLYRPEIELDKFKGLESCQSFNFGSDIKAFDWAAEHFKHATYVSKNICHTFNSNLSDFNSHPETKAGKLLYEFVKIYFDKHQDKKLHDVLPTMISTDDFDESYIALSGKPVRYENKFSWSINSKNKAVVEINYENFYGGLLRV